MSPHKTLLSAMLVVVAGSLAGCELGDNNADETTGTAEALEADVERHTNAPREHEDITTGSAGTTSGITGSDMIEADETIGDGLAQGDDWLQTSPAAAASVPEYEVSSPERQSQDLPDAPIGANKSGYEAPQTRPQASSSNNTDDKQ